MKKNIFIFFAILTTFSLMAFGYFNWNNFDSNQECASGIPTWVSNNALYITMKERANPDFFYDVSSRYMSTYTKKDLAQVRSMADFLTGEKYESIVSYHSVSISIIDENYETVERKTGACDVFSAAQVELLRSAPYSANILIRAEYVEKNQETGELEEGYSTPHITIVPENEAKYVRGKNALIEYLKENSKDQIAVVHADILQPGKVHFTVTRNGTISNVKLSATSGYPSIDQRMIDLITNTPGKWEPATNSKGEKVNQELVYSFGIVGC